MSATPGPWKPMFHCRNQRTLIGDWLIVGPNSNPVRLGGTVEQNVGVRANARLICAAPDMLAALQELEEFLDNQADADDGRPNDAMRHLIEVRAAIAKALGS